MGTSAVGGTLANKHTHAGPTCQAVVLQQPAKFLPPRIPSVPRKRRQQLRSTKQRVHSLKARSQGQRAAATSRHTTNRAVLKQGHSHPVYLAPAAGLGIPAGRCCHCSGELGRLWHLALHPGTQQGIKACWMDRASWMIGVLFVSVAAGRACLAKDGLALPQAGSRQLAAKGGMPCRSTPLTLILATTSGSRAR